MTYSTDRREDFSLPFPITQTARQTAQLFASQQPTLQKAEQVCLNTLAVWVVNDYLQLLGVSTNLAASDSWNPVVRLCADVADLEITGIGRIECRPLRMDAHSCSIPPEVWEDRIGMVMVQVDDSLREANILGFAPMSAVEEFPISQLQPPEHLIDHLHQLMQPVSTPSPVAASRRTVVNLTQWLNNMFEGGWQAVEELLNPTDLNLAFSFRSPDTADILEVEPQANLRRAKLIDLGIQLARHPLALVVELRPESAQRTNILLQLHPTGSQLYLPPSLQLIILDESGQTFLEAEARRADNYMQLELHGEPGEHFSVKVALGDASITEEFVI